MNSDDSLVAKWAFVDLPFVDAAIFLAAHSKVVKKFNLKLFQHEMQLLSSYVTQNVV